METLGGKLLRFLINDADLDAKSAIKYMARFYADDIFRKTRYVFSIG